MSVPVGGGSLAGRSLEPNKPRRFRPGRSQAEGRVNVLMGRSLVDQVEALGIPGGIGWSSYVRKLVEKDIKSRARKRAGGKA